ncbi:hypothetical protein BCM02_1178 [Paenibacillus methanolicus]|uniref:Uncharacterized protein n=2 Tax=Paenibacillus methanolicus TaxID=582686 RepID=A0A5S5BRW5_9BACL|nr:hypothetical protein BCM02_1178 [Paenibacillus methanolicus]
MPTGLIVNKPLDGAIAKDSMELDISAYKPDGQPANITAFIIYDGFERHYLATGAGQIRKTVPIPSAINARKVTMNIEAWGAGYAKKTIFLDRSPSYSVVDAVNGEILDFNDDKILYTGFDYSTTGDLNNVLKLLDRHTRQEIVLTDKFQTNRHGGPKAVLTPKGALFVQEIAYAHEELTEYKNGELILLGEDTDGQFYSADYEVQGHIAAFQRQRAVISKNLLTGVESVVTDNGWLSDLSEDGSIVYLSASDRKIYKFKDGASIKLSALTDPSVLESGAKTDGIRTLYMRSNPKALMLHNGTENIELAPHDTGYHIENGWIIYYKKDSQGTYQGWMISPQGESKLIPAIGTSVISPDGEILGPCISNQICYYSHGDVNEPFPVLADLGRLLYKGNQFYSITGGSILAIHATPNDITPPKTQMLVNGATPVYDGWYKAGARVEFLAQDDPAGTGVRDTRYDINNGPRQTYTGPFVLTGEDTHHYVLDFNSTDNNGNQEGQQRIVIKIDSDIPFTKSTLTPNWSADKTYIKSYTVTLRAYDQTTGVKATYYRINGGEWKTYSGPFEMDQVGERRLDFYSVDNVGNEEKHPA